MECAADSNTVCVILYGCAAKPEEGDEIKGHLPDPVTAQKYCNNRNALCKDGYAYWYEEVAKIECDL